MSHLCQRGKLQVGIALSVCSSIHLSISHPVLVSDFVWTISPEPLYHFETNLVWWYIIIRQSVMQKNRFSIFSVEITARAYYQIVTISTISSELLVRLQPDLV